ncbi:MAG TPA: ABC transporter ATP-binding protein [Firmicutes bacterium]|nr:ABC transporter ATP-binding protein [Bacillota bacterium]
MLKLENVYAGYGERLVLEGINLEVGDSEIVCLIGANGAGKTTTLKTIMGLVRPQKGQVNFNGDMLATQPVNRIVQAGISMAPEGRRVFGKMTVLENLEMGAYLRKDPIGQDIEEVYRLFPVLKERAKQPARVLSGGEQQMLAIGRALMAKPKLLLLDEPSMGLAPLMVEKIFEIIRRIWKTGTAILLVEQNAAMALEVSQRGYVMETGKIAMEGSAAELRRNPNVRKAFLGRAGERR